MLPSPIQCCIGNTTTVQKVLRVTAGSRAALDSNNPNSQPRQVLRVPPVSWFRDDLPAQIGLWFCLVRQEGTETRRDGAGARRRTDRTLTPLYVAAGRQDSRQQQQHEHIFGSAHSSNIWTLIGVATVSSGSAYQSGVSVDRGILVHSLVLTLNAFGRMFCILGTRGSSRAKALLRVTTAVVFCSNSISSGGLWFRSRSYSGVVT